MMKGTTCLPHKTNSKFLVKINCSQIKIDESELCFRNQVNEYSLFWKGYPSTYFLANFQIKNWIQGLIVEFGKRNAIAKMQKCIFIICFWCVNLLGSSLKITKWSVLKFLKLWLVPIVKKTINKKIQQSPLHP